MPIEHCVKYNECKYIYKGNNITIDTNLILYLIKCILLETQENNLEEHNTNMLFQDFKRRLDSCIRQLARCTHRNKFVTSEQISGQLNSNNRGSNYYHILSENRNIIPQEKFHEIDSIMDRSLDSRSVSTDEITELKSYLSDLSLRRVPDAADLSLIVSALKTSSNGIFSVIVTEDGSLIQTIRKVYGMETIELNSIRYNPKNIATEYIPTYLDGPHRMCCFDTNRFLKMYTQTSGYELRQSDQTVRLDKIKERKIVERIIQESIIQKHHGVSS